MGPQKWGRGGESPWECDAGGPGAGCVGAALAAELGAVAKWIGDSDPEVKVPRPDQAKGRANHGPVNRTALNPTAAATQRPLNRHDGGRWGQRLQISTPAQEGRRVRRRRRLLPDAPPDGASRAPAATIAVIKPAEPDDGDVEEEEKDDGDRYDDLSRLPQGKHASNILLLTTNYHMLMYYILCI